MRFLSLFAGIGGFDLGLERSGHECAGQVEIDGFCQRVLAARFDGAFLGDDVRGAPSRDQSGIDLLCGGFPCQDLSVAGKRGGLRGKRSGLFFEIPRIQREVKARWGLFENVPGLLSSHAGRDFWSVLAALAECWPAVGWRVLDSQYFGVAQRRRRVFIVCGPDRERVESVLFESEGSSGDLEAGEEAGERVASAITGSTFGSGGADDNDGQAGHLIVQQAMSSKWAKGSSWPAGDEHHNLIAFDPTAGRDMRAYDDGTSPSLKVGTGLDMGWSPAVTGAAVRRLTPVECERLQGFPDRWTCLCDKQECSCPDTPRYRALGNAVTVNVVTWLGRRLKAVE